MLLQRLFEDAVPEPAIQAALVDGAREWLWQANGSIRSLPRCLGFAPTPIATRRLLRDAYLRDAGECLGGPRGWPRAVALAEAVLYFRGYKWPYWRSRALPPSPVRPVERCLFFAFAVGLAVPSTARQFANILGCQPETD